VSEPKIVIVGAGPAGMGAAIEAVRAGARVTVLDENPRPGGQIYRQFSPGFQVTSPRAFGRDFRRGQALVAEFASLAGKMEHLGESLVWGLFPEREVAFLRHEESHTIHYDQLIIALGAYDRPVPFPGWTLPGVLTAGGAQRLVKTQRVLPGDRILLVGTGPLQLALANQIIHAGGKVAGIVEAAGVVGNWFQLACGAFGQWALLSDAWHYLWGITKARVPLLRGHAIVEARGNGKVEEAVIARVDEEWRVVPGTARTIAADVVCVGYGFVPSVELTRLAGCEHQYQPELGGWVPVQDESMATTVKGVYAAGDCAGVAGSQVALEEGRIAGIAAALALGCLSREEAERRAAPARNKLRSPARLRKAIDAISVPRRGLYELATDDTVVCRCEEITLGDIRAAISEGADDLNAIKRMTRTGMGSCQGRYCGPALQEIVARERGIPASGVVSLNPRPPVRPVPIHVLAGHGELE
jgi:NADPH-dependent 2,4-dienoyl-CoA reductase/sulfur reductase-like enzyme